MDSLRAIAESSRAFNRFGGVDAGRHIRRDLHQICAEAVQLAEARTPNDAATTSQEELGRAQRLLMSAAGIDVEANAREVQGLDLKSVFSPTDGGAAPITADVSAFIAQLHASATASVQAQAHADAMSALQLSSAAAAGGEWEAAKAAILAALGIGLPPAQPLGLQDIVAGLQAQAAVASSRRPGDAAASSSSSLLLPGLDASGAALVRPLAASHPLLLHPAGDGVGSPEGGDPGRRPASAASQQQLDAYAAQLLGVVRPLAASVQDAAPAALVERLAAAFAGAPGAGVGGGGIPVISALAAVAEGTAVDDASSGLDLSQHSRMWRLALEIAREGGGAQTLAPRCYASAYGVAPLAASDDGGGDAAGLGLGDWRAPSAGLQAQWAGGALAYLGALFAAIIEGACADNAAVAAVGGAPGIEATARGYLTLQLALHRRHWSGGHALAAAAGGGAPQPGGGAAQAAESPVPAWYAAGQRGSPSIGGHPLWPQVFLCMRAGAWAEAAALVREGRDAAPSLVPAAAVRAADATASLLGAVAADLGAGALPSTRAVDALLSRIALPASAAETGLLAAALREVELEHARLAYADASAPGGTAGAVDPWQREVYCILAGGGSGDAWGAATDSVVLASPQDTAWHLLACVVTARLHAAVAATAATGPGPARAAPAAAHPSFSLGDAAATILRGGEAAYDPSGRRAYCYAELLLAVGQPELAVAHLAVAGHAELPERHLHDAVHLALALDHYGLLRTLPAAQLETAAAAAAAGVGAPELQADPAGGSGGGLPPGVSRVPGTGGLLLTLSATSYPRATDAASGGGVPCIALDLAHLLAVYAGRVLHWAPGPSADYLACLRHRPTRMAALASLLAASRAYSELAGPLDASSLVAAPLQGLLAHHGFAGLRVVPEEEVRGIVLAAARSVRAAGAGNRAFDSLQLFLRAPEHGGLGAACDLLADATARLAPQPWTEALAAANSAADAAPARGAWPGGPQHAAPSSAPASASSTRGGASRAAWREVARSLLAGPVASGPAADDLGGPGIVGSRLHAVAVGVALCEVFDCLAAGAAEDALVAATEAGLIPAGDGGAGGGDWRRAFDPLPLAAQEAYADLLPALMQATAALWAAGVREAGRAAPGLAPGRQLYDALAATAVAADGGWASASQQQAQAMGGQAGAAALDRLRRLRALARRLASGHSAAMRRMLPPALLNGLAASEVALTA